MNTVRQVAAPGWTGQGSPDRPPGGRARTHGSHQLLFARSCTEESWWLGELRSAGQAERVSQRGAGYLRKWPRARAATARLKNRHPAPSHSPHLFCRPVFHRLWWLARSVGQSPPTKTRRSVGAGLRSARAMGTPCGSRLGDRCRVFTEGAVGRADAPRIG